MSPLARSSVTGFCEMSLLFVSVVSAEMRVFRARCHFLDTHSFSNEACSNFSAALLERPAHHLGQLLLGQAYLPSFSVRSTGQLKP